MAKRKPAASDKRDESTPSDSSRRSSSGESMSDYMADEIGALDSMRHRDRKNEKEEESARQAASDVSGSDRPDEDE